MTRDRGRSSSSSSSRDNRRGGGPAGRPRGQGRGDGRLRLRDRHLLVALPAGDGADLGGVRAQVGGGPTLGADDEDGHAADLERAGKARGYAPMLRETAGSL